VCVLLIRASVLRTKRRHDLFIYPQAGFDLSLSLSLSSRLAHTNIHSSLSPAVSVPRSPRSHSISLFDKHTHMHTHTHTHTALLHWPLGGGEGGGEWRRNERGDNKTGGWGRCDWRECYVGRMKGKLS